jgi:hypothetical protein
MTVSRTMRTGQAARMCTLRTENKNVYGIQEAKGPCEEHTRWWDDNINMGITENVFERGHWT